MRKTWNPLLFLPGVVGALAGLTVLHPFAMAFGREPWDRPLAALRCAYSLSFDHAMIPMAILFAAVGAALALVGYVLSGRPEGAEREPSAVHDSALVRICMYCKCIPQTAADRQERWLPLEQALYQARGIEFSHGICPSCLATHLLPQIQVFKAARRKPSHQYPESKRLGGEAT